MMSAQIVHAEKFPLRLVQLPIIFKNATPNQKICEIVDKKISRAVHIPLNGTLNLVEYVESNEKFIPQKNISAAVKNFAEEIDADIVVCPIIIRASEFYSHSFGFKNESRLMTDVSAELIVFDRRKNELVDKKTSRSHRGEYNKFYSANYLVGECFDSLIKSTNLKEKIQAIR